MLGLYDEHRVVLRKVDEITLGLWLDAQKADPIRLWWVRFTDCVRHKNGNCTLTLMVDGSWYFAWRVDADERRPLHVAVEDALQDDALDILAGEAKRRDVEAIPTALGAIDEPYLAVEWTWDQALELKMAMRQSQGDLGSMRWRRYKTVGDSTVTLDLYPPPSILAAVRAASGGAARPDSNLVYRVISEFIAAERAATPPDDEIPF